MALLGALFFFPPFLVIVSSHSGVVEARFNTSDESQLGVVSCMHNHTRVVEDYNV